MNKLTRLGTISILLVAAVSGTALATPRSTDMQGLNTLHRSISHLWNSPQAKEVGLTPGVFPFERGQMEPGADHPMRATNPDSHHLKSDDTKLYPPAELTCALTPLVVVALPLT